jgi:hydrogenase expression/formation protein HypC
VCLAVPARIEQIDGVNAVIELGGVRRRISLLLCPDARVGEFALVHAGFAISVIDEEEAAKGLAVFEEVGRVLESLEAPGPDRSQVDRAADGGGPPGGAVAP